MEVSLLVNIAEGTRQLSLSLVAKQCCAVLPFHPRLNSITTNHPDLPNLPGMMPGLVSADSCKVCVEIQGAL
ncbi:hypothetical protein Pcinc_025742 [Petrolisthes cinctipes]|uniref:Uncharacterized protein n=1 Tax=Petrolisthes cinctipes TaxID=88211 RepID=A0AAE1F996_PETCI|nr:hypothetical protein Pcinc_025742 [Petrolisthes cinctipes]